MSEEADVKLVVECLERMPPVQLEMDPGVAWTLLGALQLVLRHPGIQMLDMRHVIEEVARSLQGFLEQHEPELGRFAERGWHECFDRPVEE